MLIILFDELKISDFFLFQEYFELVGGVQCKLSTVVPIVNN